jgi:hypothetical protein
MNDQTKTPTAVQTLAQAKQDLAALNERVVILTDQLADARKNLEATRAFIAGSETAFKAVQEKAAEQAAAQQKAPEKK